MIPNIVAIKVIGQIQDKNTKKAGSSLNNLCQLVYFKINFSSINPKQQLDMTKHMI